MSGLSKMQYHCNTCDSMLVIGCGTCDGLIKVRPGRKRSVDSSDWTETPESTPEESESESEDSDSDVDLSELEEIDETEVLDIITDKERFEIAEEVLNMAIGLGKKYRIK